MAVEAQRPRLPVFPRASAVDGILAPESRAPAPKGLGGHAAEHPEPRADFDRVIAALVLCLTAFGLVMIYSASHVLAERSYHAGTYFLSRQTIFAVLGVAAMIAVSYVPYRVYRTLTYPILVVGLLGLVAVVGGAGTTIRGATRWIALGWVNIEPSEVAKIAVVIWLAYSVAKKRELVRSFSVGFVPHVVLAGLAALLCLLQPDFGSAMIIICLTFAILFVAGARIAYILGAVVVATPIIWQLVASSSYRMQRWMSFLDPWKYRLGWGYQLSESQISFGAGGILGQGIGDGRQKLLFLPDAHNDFISAIVGEELGLVGVLALLAVFTLLVVRGYRIAARCRDPFGSFLAFGITTLVGLQALINLGVSMGVLPTKGLTLPFVSYGGSSLLVHLAAIGVLLNISRGQSTVDSRQSTGNGRASSGPDAGAGDADNFRVDRSPATPATERRVEGGDGRA